MLVGPAGGAAERATARLEKARIRVVRVGHAAAAGERLAVAMPQLVVVLTDLRPDEHEGLTDRALAVGALVTRIDPALDAEALEPLLERIAETALERRLLRERSTEEPFEAVDGGWD